MTSRRLIRTYLVIAGLYSLSSSLIWGVNTLFLLHAGLDIFGVFVASAAFTVGMVVFEIPTGVVADAWGRRLSFLMSAAVLGLGTLGYVGLAEMHAGLLAWCAASAVLGLGFTFYSGAVEAWLVDGLRVTGYEGLLDKVFAQGALVTGAAMVVGTVLGGLLGSLGLDLPYVVRAVTLALVFVVALFTMHDLGFEVRPFSLAAIPREMVAIARAGVTYGWRRPSVRLLIVTSFLEIGFLSWGFYAWQPYFLGLLHRDAVWAAGVFAAFISLATMLGNALVGPLSRLVRRRTTLLLGASAVEGVAIVGVGLGRSLWAVALLYLVASAAMGVIFPVKQAYLHQVIPSAQRATVVSFDSMLGNAGGAAGQVGLGWMSGALSIPAGYVAGGLGTLLVLPVLGRLRGLRESADRIVPPEAGRNHRPLRGAGTPQRGRGGCNRSHQAGIVRLTASSQHPGLLCEKKEVTPDVRSRPYPGRGRRAQYHRACRSGPAL